MKSKKYLVFDAGPLISLTMNGLLGILEKLKKDFNGEFIITPSVKAEVIDKPLKIKKYEFEGVRIKDLLERGILKLSSDFISNGQLEKETARLLDIANSSFKSLGTNINLIHNAETSCLAFSNLCKCDNVIVIDERTTRLLVENPENLKKIFEKKLHSSVSVDNNKLKNLKDFRFIRSAELLYLAYERDLLDLKKDKTLLDSILYAVKYTGTSISSGEIEDIKNL